MHRRNELYRSAAGEQCAPLHEHFVRNRKALEWPTGAADYLLRDLALKTCIDSPAKIGRKSCDDGLSETELAGALFEGPVAVPVDDRRGCTRGRSKRLGATDAPINIGNFGFEGREFCTLRRQVSERFSLLSTSASSRIAHTAAARRLRRCRRFRGGILDCRCTRRSARRQVGTKGWPFPIEQRDAALVDLNEPPHSHHDQFAELDAHN